MRTVRRCLVALLALAVLGGGFLLALIELSPSVNDAPQLVQARLAAHHAPSDGGSIPAKVAAALLATEDSRFYQDPALDPLGVLRATWGTVTSNSAAGGATLELQLAKLLYTGSRSGVPGELEQVGLAFRLDAHFSKHTILAMYLDAAYFGDGAYGVTAAANHYFARQPDQLSWAQASMLAGLVQAPTAYDPHGHLTLALQRRAHVLQRLVATGDLKQRQVNRIDRQALHPNVPFDN